MNGELLELLKSYRDKEARLLDVEVTMLRMNIFIEKFLYIDALFRLR